VTWQQAQEWEGEWWGFCTNTYGEEEKQLVYARKMGLRFFHDSKSPYNIDMKGLSVLDIGGGPCSLLLKCHNVKGKVVDPLEFPAWVAARYAVAGIEYEQRRGEDVQEAGWDECWLYNVLQHTADPELIVKNAKRAGQIVRVFEWIDIPTNVGHPHSLSEQLLNEWLGGEGRVEQLTGGTCRGLAYYGVFL